MPRSKQRRRNGTRGRAQSQGRSSNRGLVTLGIVVAVIVVVGALVFNGVRQSSGGDFAFEVYQGEGVLGGDEMRFSEVFEQGKPVVLNFWAGLCPPCRAEMPGFQTIYDQYGEDFVLLGLDVGPFTNLGSNRDAQDLLQEMGITYPAGRALDRAPVAQYGVFSMPTTVFLTPDRQVFTVHSGFLDQARMEALVQQLVDVSRATS